MILQKMLGRYVVGLVLCLSITAQNQIDVSHIIVVLRTSNDAAQRENAARVLAQLALIASAQAAPAIPALLDAKNGDRSNAVRDQAATASNAIPVTLLTVQYYIEATSSSIVASRLDAYKALQQYATSATPNELKQSGIAAALIQRLASRLEGDESAALNQVLAPIATRSQGYQRSLILDAYQAYAIRIGGDNAEEWRPLIRIGQPTVAAMVRVAENIPPANRNAVFFMLKTAWPTIAGQLTASPQTRYSFGNGGTEAAKSQPRQKTGSAVAKGNPSHNPNTLIKEVLDLANSTLDGFPDQWDLKSAYAFLQFIGVVGKPASSLLPKLQKVADFSDAQCYHQFGFTSCGQYHARLAIQLIASSQ